MILTCPTCNHEHHVDAYAAQAEQAEFLRALAQTPNGLASLVMRYLAVFKPGTRKLASWRARDLVCELLAMMESPSVAYDRTEHHISTNAWRHGLSVVIEQLQARQFTDLPLKNHNYLIKCAIGYRESSARSAPSDAAPRSALQDKVAQAVDDFS